MGFFDSKADKMNEMAAEFIAEGDELKREYNNLSVQAKNKSKEIEKKFRVEAEYKNQVLAELGNDIHLSLERFQNLDIDNHIFENISLESKAVENHGEHNFLNIISSGMKLASTSVGMMPTRTDFGLLGIVSALINNAEAEDNAYRNHQMAKEYMYKMDNAVEQVKNVLIGMDAIEKLVRDEHDTIEKLMNKIRKLKSTLDAADKSVYAQAEADYLKSIYSIAKKIQESLNRKIVDDNGKITADYNDYCSELKNINKGLPSTPALNDGKTAKWLELIGGSIMS